MTNEKLDYLMLKAREDFATELSMRVADLKLEMTYAPSARKVYLRYKSDLMLTVLGALKATIIKDNEKRDESRRGGSIHGCEDKV